MSNITNNALPKDIFKKYPPDIKNYISNMSYNKFISKKTNIMSMGSCFASHIASYLREKNYNYLLTEEPSVKKKAFSANWGRVYNPKTMEQIFERSIEQFNPDKLWWTTKEYAYDLYRHKAIYKKKEKNKRLKEHLQASKKAIMGSEVLILTLGLIETWRTTEGYTLYGYPRSLYDSKTMRPYILNVEECIQSLQNISNIVKKYNSKATIIFSLSPIPFSATTRKEIDPISANMISKSTLRIAINEVVTNNDNTIYFPSYEYIIMGVKDKFLPDGRHVQPKVIHQMMQVFENMFCYQ